MSDTVVYPPNCQPITKCRNNAELIKCLKGLKDALSNAESNEEAGQPDRYSKLALLLVQPKLLDNANDDVRVLLACSIASLFRIFAPNSPIGDPATLKNVLLFLVRTLDGLSDASGPNYKYYYFLLEILSVVETLQLALELSDDSLVVLSCLIKTSLGIIEKRKTHDEVTQSILISMCSKLIQGVDQISDQVLDAIFFYLVPPQKLNNQESFRMARSLVQKNAAALGPAIKVVLAQGLTSGALANCKMTGNKCLHVLEEMNAIIPEIVAPLYDLLIPNLQSEDVGRRLSFVKVVGRLLAQTNSRIAEDVPDLWKAYISRYKDIDETVRTECVKQSLDILVNHPELRGQISDAVIQRLHDMNENIRIECVRLVFTLAKRRFEAVSEDLLANTAERIRDKKVRVRHEAIRVLSLLHRYVFTNEFTKSERSSVSIIFKNILNVYYQPFAEDRVLIERLLFSNLIPFKAVASDRMQILIDCVLSLDASAVRVIEEIFNKQSRMRTQLLKINESIASDFSEQESSIMAKKIDFIASFQPDPSKAAVLIRHFIDFLQSDKRTNDLLMEMLSCKQSTRESEGTLVEIIQRMRDKLPNDVSSFNQSILERCCPLTFDSEAVDQLVSKVFAVIQRAVLLPVGSRSDNNAKLLLKLMKIVERNYAVHFMADKPVKMLCKMLELDDQEIVEDVLDVLHDLLMNTKSKVENIPKSTVDAMIDTCVNIAKCGKLRAAKRAVKCLSLLLIEDIDGTAKITDIAEDAISHISIDDPRCSTAMMVLGACAQAFPETFKGRLKKIVSEDVVDIVLNDDINNINSTSLNMPSDELVVEEFDRSSHYSSIIAEMLNSENHGRKCLMKLRALKLITNYLVTMSKSIDDGITHLMLKTVRMLKELVTSHGSLFRSIYSVNDKGALRAVAGCCIIKLAEVPVFAKLIPVDDFLSLGYLIRDDLSFVRHHLCCRLMKGLRNCFLPIEYMGLLALIAMHKDDVEFQRKMRYLLDKEFTQRRRLLLTPEATAKAAYLLPEYCIPYAVYILSKQPMLSSHNDVATLMTFKECLWFLLEIFHSRKEIRGCEFICSMLQVMKNSRDATMEECAPKERDEQNKKMWALCDLGILLLSYRMVIAARGQQQRVNLSKRFILRSQSNKIYLPEVIIEQEKKKVHHGRKVPDSSHSRSAAFGSSKASTSKLLESHSEISAKIFTDGSDSVKQSLRRSLPTRSAKVTRKCELRSADISRQSRKSVRSHQKTTKINNATSYGLEDEASSPSPSKSPGRKQIEHDSSPMSSTSSQNRKVASDGTHSAKTSRRSAFSLRTSFSDFSPILPNDFAAKGKAAVTKPSRGALVSSTPLVSSKTRKNSNSVTDVLLRRSVLRSYTERRSQVKGESHKNVESLTDNGRKRKRKSSKDQFSDAAAEEVTKGQEEELTSDEVKTHHSPLRHKPSTKKRLSSQKKMSLKEKHLPDGAKKTAVSRLSSRSKVQKPSALLGSKNVHLCPESIKESVDAKLINESNEFSASCIGINDVRKKSDGKRRDVQSGQEQGSVKDVSNNGFKARKGPISDLSPQRRSPRKVRQKLINGNAIRGKDSLKSGSKRQMSLRRRPRHR